MGGRDDATATGWPVPARAAAIVGLTVGLAACGAGAVHQTATADTPTSSPARVVLRQQALGTAVDAQIELDCSTPTASSGGRGGVAIASSTAQRWHAPAVPGHDWTTVVDVAAGATCTATDRPLPPAVLRSVTGGTSVYDGETLTGVRATADPGATTALTLVASGAT
ncbi:MAG TPA: hypothetical protein VFC33_20760 [Acidimicrobiia bacterium]|nr:hypothetical protein [Acidimicrobiia bacterium]